MEKIRIWVRDFLIGLAKNFDSDRKGPVLRNTKQFLQAEVKIPIVLSMVFTFIIVYAMLIMDMGYTYRTFLAAGIMMLTISYVFIFETRKEQSLVSDNDAVVLMCLNLIIAVLFMQVSQHYISIFVFPVSAFVIMGVMLLAPRIGLCYAIILSLLAGFISDMRFDVFMILLGSATVVLSRARKIRNRWDFVKTGLLVTIANIIIISMFYLLTFYSFGQYEKNLYYGLLNGLFMIIILLVILPIFERIFSRTTNIKLIELADFNNHLLKRLMLEAPGTYHHSILTASIAEQAAEAIGENPILARVASYYHDIGKLNNPEYFIENQGTTVNPHNDLSPAMSTLILTSHIKDGAALAKQYNLDNDIISCIVQHHGTTVMSSFYNKARSVNGGEEELNSNDFRYPGPKPQSKIAAIIMIADSCEAACRTIDEPTDAKISEMVNRVVDLKMKDEQFSECPITFKELELVKESLMSALLRMYHSRIKYQETYEQPK
ncbi:MAG: HDIG domain-containing protein [Elusimicrobiota bacterium]|jgi:putative nucleotidyltransferase with HDIG domain|nr:HDIG domain-containing protein [Elusimicrobiota bacterium]